LLFQTGQLVGRYASDVAEQLKRQGASIPGVRPGPTTRDYITRVLERLSLLGSVFLGLLALTPTVGLYKL
jgi:preprotein translocase subunit SecY